MLDTLDIIDPEISLVRDGPTVIGLVLQCDDGGEQAQVVSFMTGAPVEVPNCPRIIRMVGCQRFIDWLAQQYPVRTLEVGDSLPARTTHVIPGVMPIAIEQDDVAFPFRDLQGAGSN